MNGGHLAVVPDQRSALHRRDSCPTCLRLARAAMGRLEHVGALDLEWSDVVALARTTGPPLAVGGHVDHVEDALDHAYRLLLARMLVASRRAHAVARTWQEAMIAGMRAGVRELEAHPGAIRLHYVETELPGGESLRRVRDRFRDRLLAEVCAARPDAPSPLGVEMLFGMMLTMLRGVDGPSAALPQLGEGVLAATRVAHRFDRPSAFTLV